MAHTPYGPSSQVYADTEAFYKDHPELADDYEDWRSTLRMNGPLGHFFDYGTYVEGEWRGLLVANGGELKKTLDAVGLPVAWNLSTDELFVLEGGVMTFREAEKTYRVWGP